MAFGKEKNQAIRKFCLGCVGNSAAEVRLCSSKTCPLFPFRMGSLNKAAQIDGVDYASLFLSQKSEPFDGVDESERDAD